MHHRIVSYGIVSYRMAWHVIVSYHTLTAPHRTVSYRIALTTTTRIFLNTSRIISYMYIANKWMFINVYYIN